MKQENKLAWFVLYTGWSAIISNGWWILETQKLNDLVAALVAAPTLLLSVAYVIVLGHKFISALDEK